MNFFEGIQHKTSAKRELISSTLPLAHPLVFASHNPPLPTPLRFTTRPGLMPIIAQQQGPIMNLVPPSSYGMETNGLPPMGNAQGIQGDASVNVRLLGHGGERGSGCERGGACFLNLMCT